MAALDNSNLGKPSQKNSNFSYFFFNKMQIKKYVDIDNENSTENIINEFKEDDFDRNYPQQAL